MVGGTSWQALKCRRAGNPRLFRPRRDFADDIARTRSQRSLPFLAAVQGVFYPRPESGRSLTSLVSRRSSCSWRLGEVGRPSLRVF